MSLVCGSVCSGIEAASVAWHPLGWKFAFYSEIDLFARAVIEARHPGVPIHGNFTTIQPGDYAAIDLLVGGTPCQSFSVAGLRGGMADERGNLALEYLRLAHRLRPRWLVWENVPGVLSSNGGRDFGSILGGMVELGYGFAYRVLDAQYVRTQRFPHAVPQRRRRVFVVGYLGDWRPAFAALYPLGDGMSGHPAPRREAGQRTSPTLAARTRSGGGLGTDFDCDGGLILAPDIARCVATREGSSQDWETTTMVAHSLRAEGFDASEDGTGRGTPLVPIAFHPTQEPIHSQGVCHALNANANATAAIAFDSAQITSRANRTRAEPGLPASTLSSASRMHVAGPMQVRRLTPRECERLMGFPDDYTLIQYRGKPAADGPRYKALGNSMAVNVMSWIGERIQAVEDVLRRKA